MIGQVGRQRNFDEKGRKWENGKKGKREKGKKGHKIDDNKKKWND